jgi:hypothetical protein
MLVTPRNKEKVPVAVNQAMESINRQRKSNSVGEYALRYVIESEEGFHILVKCMDSSLYIPLHVTPQGFWGTLRIKGDNLNDRYKEYKYMLEGIKELPEMVI